MQEREQNARLVPISASRIELLTAELFKRSKIGNQNGAIFKQRNLNLISNECLGIKELFCSNTHKSTHLTQIRAHQSQTILKKPLRTNT